MGQPCLQHLFSSSLFSSSLTLLFDLTINVVSPAQDGRGRETKSLALRGRCLRLRSDWNDEHEPAQCTAAAAWIGRMRQRIQGQKQAGSGPRQDALVSLQQSARRRRITRASPGAKR